MGVKYEVVPFASGNGYFIHGGRLRGVFIEEKRDADQICDALNLAAALKTRDRVQQVVETITALEEVHKLLIRD